MQYLNLALRAVQLGRHDSTRGPGGSRPAEHNSRGQTRKRAHEAAFAIPFGPNLAPVCRAQQGLNVGSEGAARTQPQKIQASPDLTQSGLNAGAGGALDCCAEDCWEAVHGAVTTNDLLDCLAHPDIIARVTKLLLERHAGNTRSAPFC